MRREQRPEMEPLHWPPQPGSAGPAVGASHDPAPIRASRRQSKTSRRSTSNSRLLLAAISAFTFTSCASLERRAEIAKREERLYNEAPALHESTAPKDDPAPVEAVAPEDALQSYIRTALIRNGSLRAAFDRWASAMERIPQTTALPDPMFTWLHFVEEVQTRTGPQENRFTLTQKFPWFQKLMRQGDAAADHAESLWWEVEATRLRVVRNVKNAYYEYAYLARAIQIVDENLALLKSLEPIVQRNIQVGGGQSDLIRLQVEIGKLENELAGLRDFRRPLNARLTAVLNQIGGQTLPWPEFHVSDVRPVDQEDVRRRFNDLNPDLKTLFWQIERAQSLERRARLEGVPDITLGVMYTETSDHGPLPRPRQVPSFNSSMRPTIPPPRQFPEGDGEDPWGISLGFNVPIWWQKYRAGVREARSQRASTEQQLRQKRFDLLAEVDLKTYEVDDAARQVALYEESLIPRAQQALEVTQIAYESGKASFLDIIDAQREFLAFEKAYWRSLANYYQRRSDLEMLCGGPLS